MDIVSPVGGEVNPVTSRPFRLHWNADALAAGNYDLRVIGTSTAGLVDGAPGVTVLTVNVGAVFFERDAGGVHTLTAPVVIASDNEVVVSDTVQEAGVAVTIPATALTSDTTLEVAIMDGTAFTPILGSREILTDIFIDLTLLSGQVNFANGQLATIQLSYPDVNSDGVLDNTNINENFLRIMFLNQGTNQFEPLQNDVVDTIGNTVTAQTSHFSVFALVGVVPPAPLQITSTSPLPQAWEQQVQPYSQSLSATGGDTPYTWSLTNGNLPPGLSLVGDTITGTPTLEGVYSFWVKATDSQSPADREVQAFAITVNKADLVRPRVVQAFVAEPDTLWIRFSEAMKNDAALLNTANYTFNNGLVATGPISVILPNLIEVGVATLDEMTTYTLTVNTGAGGPTDPATNSVDPGANTAVFTGMILLPGPGVGWVVLVLGCVGLVVVWRRLRRA